jgi:hypothetical protein
MRAQNAVSLCHRLCLEIVALQRSSPRVVSLHPVRTTTPLPFCFLPPLPSPFFLGLGGRGFCRLAPCLGTLPCPDMLLPYPSPAQQRSVASQRQLGRPCRAAPIQHCRTQRAAFCSFCRRYTPCAFLVCVSFPWRSGLSTGDWGAHAPRLSPLQDLGSARARRCIPTRPPAPTSCPSPRASPSTSSRRSRRYHPTPLRSRAVVAPHWLGGRTDGRTECVS